MDLLGLIVTLFIVIDPFGNIPIFTNVLQNVSEERRQKILVRELLIALVVMLVFLFIGKNVMDFLELKPATLRVSGGVVLFVIALGMIFPAKSMLGESDEDEPFIVPLAVPLMAGPSALALIMLFSVKYQGQLGALTLAVFSAWLVCAVVLFFSTALMKRLGRKGMRAIERLMGMVLIMIAVQMLLEGIASFFTNHA